MYVNNEKVVCVINMPFICIYLNLVYKYFIGMFKILSENT